MTPIEFYKQKIASNEILEDARQLAVMQSFQALYERLVNTHSPKNGWLRSFKKPAETKGIYLWGEVGIGKTFLIDTFFYCLPFEQKLRIHFYQFMRKVHAVLHELEGTPNPLQHIAKQWAKKARVICFDELLVNDVADAMLLEELITNLIKEGVCLVFTSNMAPDDLYQNGLQRQRFLPAIEAIKKHLDVIHLTTQDDYRLRDLTAEKYYLFPLTTINHEKLAKIFADFTQHAPVSTSPIEICDRHIPIKAQSEKVIWFEFNHICGIPRSNQDYLEISEMFDAVFISGVTVIHEKEHDLARSFIQLVDVFYDANTKLVMLGAVPVENIYPKGRFSFEFQRTVSRLKEMFNA